MIKKSTVASISLHIIIITLLFVLQQTSNILIPSRSDGMEVSLVSPEDLHPSPRIITKPSVIEPINVQTTPAEINVPKQETKPIITPKPEEAKPLPVTPVEKIPAKPVTKPVKIPTAKDQLSDMISDITPTANKHSGTATGGTSRGTANSNSLVGDYADLVVRTVRPFIVLPNNVNKNATAIVKVTLLPNMQVYQIKLEKSSGNDEYDTNVQQAVKNVRVFPPLPDGAKFNDYRVLRLVFQPE